VKLSLASSATTTNLLTCNKTQKKAKFISEIPLSLVTPIFFGTVVYFMAGLQVDAAKFGYFTLALCLTTFASQGLGFAIR